MENKNIIEVDGKRFMKVKKGAYYNKKNKRKIHHPIRWILITCLTVFIVAPVSFIFGAFYEPGTKANLPTETNYLTNFETKLAESLLDIPSGKITIGVDEGSTDTLLAYARTMLNNTPANNFIDNIYCYINGYNYEFVGEAHALFFKTKVHIYTTLNSEGDYLRFKINDIKVGRLPLGNLASSILPRFLSEDTLNNMFTQAGLNAKFSLANKEITYKKTDFRVDIGKKLTSLLGEVGSTLGSVIMGLWNDLSESGISFKDGISIKLNLTKLMQCDDREIHENNNICTTQTRMSKYIHFAEDCLKNGYLAKDNAKDFINFFITGYKASYEDTLFINENLKTKTTEFINNSLSISGETYKTYKGDLDSEHQDKSYRHRVVDDIVEIINGEKPYDYEDSRFKTNYQIGDLQSFFTTNGTLNGLLTLGDDLLSDYFRSPNMSLIGPIMAMPLSIGDKVYLPTITIADFSTKFFKDETGNIHLVIDSDLDLYGALIPIRIDTIVNSELLDTGRYISFNIQSINLGNITLGEEVEPLLINYLAKALPEKEGNIFSFDSSSKSFRISASSFKFTGGEGGIPELVSKILEGKEDKDITFEQEFSGTKFTATYNPKKIEMYFTLDENGKTLNLSLINTREY